MLGLSSVLETRWGGGEEGAYSKAKAKEGASHSDGVAESGLVHLLPIEDGGLEKESSLKPLVVTSDGGCGGGRNSEGLVFLLLMRAAVLVLERVLLRRRRMSVAFILKRLEGIEFPFSKSEQKPQGVGNEVKKERIYTGNSTHQAV